MNEYGEVPTERARDVWEYVEIGKHTIKEAEEHFGIGRRMVYQHINNYRDRNPLPADYITLLRQRAKSIAELGLSVIEDNLRSDKPDLHTALQLNKGTGVLVEKQEIETSLVVHDSVSPEERFKAIRDEWAKRNLDFHPEVPDVNTTPSVIANVKTDTGEK